MVDQSAPDDASKRALVVDLLVELEEPDAPECRHVHRARHGCEEGDFLVMLMRPLREEIVDREIVALETGKRSGGLGWA